MLTLVVTIRTAIRVIRIVLDMAINNIIHDILTMLSNVTRLKIFNATALP